MQPPGGPPGDKRHPLPPPWSRPKDGATPAPTPPTPPTKPKTTLTGTPPLQQPPAPPADTVPTAVPVAVSQAITAPGPAPAPGPPIEPPVMLTPQPAPLPRPPQPGQPKPAVAPVPVPAPSPEPASGYLPPSPFGSSPLPLIAPPEPKTPPRIATPAQGFVELVKISLRRGFRVRIVPDEVLPAERATLAAASITDPTAQAFLAWRRSVLLVIAAALAPLALLRLVELIQLAGQELYPGEKSPGAVTALRAIPMLVTLALAGVAWMQLRDWTRWSQQRRRLAWGCAAFFAAPFVVYLIPLGALYPAGLGDALGPYTAFMATFAIAPLILALAPGVVRAAVATKLLFPGTSAPGWVIVIAAAVGAVLTVVTLVYPYHLTSSGYFVLAIAGIVTGLVLIARAGFALTRPQAAGQAAATFAQAHTGYLIAIVGGAGLAVVAFAMQLDEVDLGVATVINLVLTAGVGLLALTLVGTDLLLATMHRAGGDVAARTLADDAQDQLATFVQEPR